MVLVPAATVETIPEVAPIVATPVLLLLHVPLPASVSVAVDPRQIVVIPAIGAGVALTVVIRVA